MAGAQPTSQVSLPPWNRTPGGQETEVYLRLDERPAAPGISVAHQRAAHNAELAATLLA